MKNVVTVKQPDTPIKTEILAEAIVRLGDAVKKLEADGGLNRRAVIVLLQDATGKTKREITTILDALPRLHGWYCR